MRADAAAEEPRTAGAASGVGTPAEQEEQLTGLPPWAQLTECRRCKVQLCIPAPLVPVQSWASVTCNARFWSDIPGLCT